jgi:hypothetical protein
MVAYISAVALPAKAVQTALIWFTVRTVVVLVHKHGSLYKRCGTACKGGTRSALIWFTVCVLDKVGT